MENNIKYLKSSLNDEIAYCHDDIGSDISIFFFGGEILKGFSFAMILGVFFGTYSSIYIANPILVFLRVSQKTILKEDKD